MPRKVIAANWKMHKSKAEAVGYIDALLALLPELAHPEEVGVEVYIFPTFLHLSALVARTQGTAIRIGAQDCYTKPEGAFTGEVAPDQIKDAGASAVLVGHSERRHIIGEDNILVAEKLKAVIQAGLTAFLCVGETKEERKEGLAYSVVEDQLMLPLLNSEGISPENLVIAYEPVWAIGTGDNAEPSDADKMADFIREWLVHHLPKGIGEEISILYGGSVKPGLLRAYLESGKLQGALVGGASLNAPSFAELFKEMF